MSKPQRSMDTITVLLVDDHRVMRQGLRMLLETQPDIRVVGDVSTADEALMIATLERPDIVLLDLALGERNGAEIIPALAAMPSAPRVLVLTGVRDTERHRQAIRLGASGVVLKEQAADLLVKAVRRVHDGELWVDRGMTAAIVHELRSQTKSETSDPEAARVYSLTPRERQIVALVSQGHGTRRIANTLFISEKTVRNHLLSIYDKLQVSERLELALYAVRHGLAASSNPSD